MMYKKIRSKATVALYALLIHAGVAISGIAPATDAKAENNPALSQKQLDAFISKGMKFSLKDCKLQPPVSCAGKPPIKETKEKRETSNDLYVDQRTLVFDGLEIELWYVLKDPLRKIKNPYLHPSILSVTITKPQWPIAHGLQVGASDARVFKMLGSKGDTSGGTSDSCVEYSVDGANGIIFCFAGHRVKSIQWQPWNDS